MTPPSAFYSLVYDLNWSPYAGGEDLLLANRFIEWAESPFIEKFNLGPGTSISACLQRSLEMVLVYLPLNYEEMLTQHEVFGHGYRARSFSSSCASVAGYEFGIPPPYGWGGGGTLLRLSDSITASQLLAIDIAGVEATGILGNLALWKWIPPQRIDPKTVFLYLLTRYDLGMYAWTLKDVRRNGEFDLGHDLDSYLHWLNLVYPQKHLSSSRVRSLTWISLLDPFTFYAFGTLSWYIGAGSSFTYPMIRLKKHLKWLPAARMELTPFGPEYLWENYIRYKGRLIYGYIKMGRHAYNNYYGIGTYAPYLLDHDFWKIGFRFDLWYQPQLLLFEGSSSLVDITDLPLFTPSQLHDMQWGAAGSLIATLDYAEWGGASLEFGAKSQGYLPGYALQTYPTIRISANFAF